MSTFWKMFLCSLRYCLKCYFSKGVYSFTLSTVYITQRAAPHCTAAHRENSQCSRWPVRHRMKPLPQKYAMGNWLAGPVCCDWLNHQCAYKLHTPQLTGMCSSCIVNNGVVYIAYKFEPIETQRMLVNRLTQNLCTAPNGMFFVYCCLILLDTLLFVNATAFNIRFYPD